MVRILKIFILLLVSNVYHNCNAQSINWDSLLNSNEAKMDSLLVLRNSLNRYSNYWNIDSNANNGFRFLYGNELRKTIPISCLPIDFVIHYLGRPYEIYELRSECTVYKFLTLQIGNELNKNHNYYSLLCFCVNPKTKIIEKTYFAYEGH